MTKLEIEKFVKDNIKYKDWEFHIKNKGETIYLQIQFVAPDNIDSSKVERQHCRKWQLSEFMTETEIVETSWKAVRMAEEHEAKEMFLYKGAAIFNTHTDVNKLAGLHKQNVNILDMRH